MRSPDDIIPIPRYLLTRWASSCLHMNGHGTVVQWELEKTQRNARAIDLTERARPWIEE